MAQLPPIEPYNKLTHFCPPEMALCHSLALTLKLTTKANILARPFLVSITRGGVYSAVLCWNFTQEAERVSRVSTKWTDGPEEDLMRNVPLGGILS